MVLQVGLAAVIALTAFAVWEVIKEMIPTDVPNWLTRIVIVSMCVYMCVVASVDILSEFGLVLPSFLGAVFTGIISSKGSNGVHDFADKLTDALKRN